MTIFTSAFLFGCKHNDPLTDNYYESTVSIEDYYPVETQPVNIEELINEAFSLALSEMVSDDDPIYLKKLAEISECKIESISEENSRYVIKTIIYSPNLGEKLMNLNYSDLPTDTNEKAINTYICELIDNLECVETEAYAYAEWSGERVTVSFTDEFADAVCGKLYSYAKNALIDYMEENNK